MTRDAALQWIIGWTFRRDVALSAEARDDLLAVLTLPALTARSEGFRELEAEIVQAAVDAYKGEYQVDVHIHLANLTRRYIDLSALSPRETDAKTEADRQIAIGLEYLRKKVQDEPTSAPSAEVAEMVKTITEWRGSTIPIGIAREAAALLSKVGQGDKGKWAVFCALCGDRWSVSHPHPGKSICADCEYKYKPLPPPPERP